MADISHIKVCVMQTKDSALCPHGAKNDRKSSFPEPQSDGATLWIKNFDEARTFLRAGNTSQAGFRAELLNRFVPAAHAPVLYQEGEAHQKQRSATARFFAPSVVAARYKHLMEATSERLLTRFIATGTANLDDMTLDLAVTIAAEVIGLTSSTRPGMAARLNRFFDPAPPQGRVSTLINFLRSQLHLLNFYRTDVRPAIRARRLEPREDVISHLLSQNFSNREIMIECLTYGAAGMATTREFITMAAWHFFSDDALRQTFLTAGEPARLSLLEEILRLEPVVGALYRRTGQDFTIGGKKIPADTRIGIDIRAVNTDPAAAGACPFAIDPARARPGSKAAASLMSFGDGPHRCPGAAVALQESAIFLHRLFSIPNLRLVHAPATSWNGITAGYELRGALLRLD